MKGPPLLDPQHPTIDAALANAARSPFGITFVDLQEQEQYLSYGALHARAERVAGALQVLGVAPGDRVAIVLPTGATFVEAFFGVLRTGAVPVPLYPPLRLGRLAEYHQATARMLRAAGARLVLGDSRTGSLIGPAIEQARPELGWRSAEGLGDGEPATPAADGNPDALALIQFSSGSTTEPKPVALSHRQVMAQLEALRMLLPPEDALGHRGVSWLPLYHDMGLIGCLLLAVYYPGALILIPPEHFLARPALWLRAIARHRATLSVSPTFGYALATRRVRAEEIAGVDLTSWRLAVCGAEPIPLEALQGFARRFAAQGFDGSALRPVYGLAEAALAVTFAPAAKSVKALAVDPARLAATGEVARGQRSVVSLGAPVPGFEVEVRGGDGRALPESRVGRIFARGPSVMAGYYGRPDATAETLRHDWLDTGDLGFVSAGELYVCGREKDVVIIRGANHVPQEFEECLEGIDGLRAGRAVALGFVPEGEDGEQLLVLAERAKDARRGASDRGTIERVRRAVLERTGIRPHTVRLLAPGTLPRTSSGKLRRSEALRRFLAGELTPTRRLGPLRLGTEMLRSALAFARIRLGFGRQV